MLSSHVGIHLGVLQNGSEAHNEGAAGFGPGSTGAMLRGSRRRRHVPLAGDHHGPSRQPVLRRSLLSLHPFPQRLSLQASQGNLEKMGWESQKAGTKKSVGHYIFVVASVYFVFKRIHILTSNLIYLGSKRSKLVYILFIFLAAVLSAVFLQFFIT